jgi:hypothetical protein
VADLETTNEKCAALAKELDDTKLEMEKLQLFKFKSHQSDTREDTLQSKVRGSTQQTVVNHHLSYYVLARRHKAGTDDLEEE